MTLDLLIVMTIIAALGAALSVYWSVMSYRQHRTNLIVSRELEKIIDNTASTIHKTKDTIKEQRKILDSAQSGAQDLLETPELMSTIIAVLVNKYGDVRLGMTDFMISDEEYVSVYVDTQTQEIILSMDNNLTSAESYMSYINPDDKTFH